MTVSRQDQRWSTDPRGAMPLKMTGQTRRFIERSRFFGSDFTVLQIEVESLYVPGEFRRGDWAPNAWIDADFYNIKALPDSPEAALVLQPGYGVHLVKPVKDSYEALGLTGREGWFPVRFNSMRPMVLVLVHEIEYWHDTPKEGEKTEPVKGWTILPPR